LDGAGGDAGKGGGESPTGDVGVARAIHGDAQAPILATAPQEGGVDHGVACRIELGHEGVATAALGSLVDRLDGGGGDAGKGAGEAITGDVGVARAVDRDGEADVASGAAQERRVHDRGARRVDLGHEGVDVAAVGRLNGAGADAGNGG